MTSKGLQRSNSRGVGASAPALQARSIKERLPPILPYPSTTPHNISEQSNNGRCPRSCSSDTISAVSAPPPRHTVDLSAGRSRCHPPPSPLPTEAQYHTTPQTRHPISNPPPHRITDPLSFDSVHLSPPILPPLRPFPSAPPLAENQDLLHSTVAPPGWLPQATSPPTPSSSYTVPQIEAQARQHYSLPPLSESQPPHTSSPLTPSQVEYSTSGTFTVPPLQPPRYPARHSVDQWALSAFRLVL